MQAWQDMPMILDIAPDRGFYAVPPRDRYGLKVGDHRFSLKGDPDAPRRALAGEGEGLRAACAHRLRDIDRYAIIETKVCFYDVEPQERFMLAALGHKGLVMSGFSGHGFKFGPLMGQRLADHLEGRLPLDRLAAYAAGRG